MAQLAHVLALGCERILQRRLDHLAPDARGKSRRVDCDTSASAQILRSLGVRLEWDGKPTQVERISLPFQTVETINESRATRERKVRPLARGRRLRAYLATGHDSDQLADARWVA
jgi:hypothetical protein